MNIEDVYRPDIPTCSPSDTLRDVAKRMEEVDTGLVAVVEGRRVQAVITERDLVRALAEDADAAAANVMDYATRDVVVAGPQDDTSVVGRRMVEHGIRRLPVVTADGELVGMVSMRDLFTVDTLLSDESGDVI